MQILVHMGELSPHMQALTKWPQAICLSLISNHRLNLLENLFSISKKLHDVSHKTFYIILVHV